MKSITGGSSDFKEIRDYDAYFVDKSGLISEILDDRKKAYLFTRPRRFGKSMNLSMLDAFFNLKYPKDNKWFDGLEISDRKDLQVHKNAYPVIYLDLKISYTEYDDIVRRLKEILGDAVKHHSYLLTSELIEKSDRDRLQSVYDRKCDITECVSAMYTLTEALETYHGKKTIILIDEYDNIPMKTYKSKDFPKIINLVRELILSSTKGNDHLFFAVMTGVTQISKESIFSGSNHIKVYNIFNKPFSNRFGFTSDEVKQICKDFGHPEKFEEAKEWYDGYRFGDDDIFNPWSVLTYVESGFTPDIYWVNTGQDNVIKDMLSSSNRDVRNTLLALSKGEPVRYRLREGTIFSDIESNDPIALFSVSAMAGYINAIAGEGTARKEYLLSIPNKEIGFVFADVMLGSMENAYDIVATFTDAMLRGDTDAMGSNLYDMLINVGYLILRTERDYQNFIAALSFCLNRDYKPSVEKERGNGRADIVLEKKNGGTEQRPNVCIELKKAKVDQKTPEKLDALALDALSQIKEMDYTHGMTGKTILYGVAMNGKKPTIRSEILYL